MIAILVGLLVLGAVGVCGVVLMGAVVDRAFDNPVDPDATGHEDDERWAE